MSSSNNDYENCLRVIWEIFTNSDNIYANDSDLSEAIYKELKNEISTENKDTIRKQLQVRESIFKELQNRPKEYIDVDNIVKKHQKDFDSCARSKVEDFIKELCKGLCNKHYKYSVFEPLLPKEMMERIMKFHKSREFIYEEIEKKYNVSIYSHSKVFNEIIERVEKRRIYYHIFHNGMDMGEINEEALFVFWIIKFMPYYDSSKKLDAHNLNMLMALYFFVGFIVRYGNGKKYNEQNFKNIQERFLYHIKFRDVTKEEIQLIFKIAIDAIDESRKD